MKLIIITVLLSLLSLSHSDGTRLGGRRGEPMLEEVEVEDVEVDIATATSIPTVIEEELGPEETCCSCPDIPEGLSEEEIYAIFAEMECDSFCEIEEDIGPEGRRNLQYMSIGGLGHLTVGAGETNLATKAPTTDPCAGPSTKRRSRSLQYGEDWEGWGLEPPPTYCHGAVKFIDCDLSQVRWIPEDDGNDGNSMPPHPKPGNGIWYHGDGLCFPGYTNFWKIPNHCEVTFKCEGKKLDVVKTGKGLGDWRFTVEPKVVCDPGWACGLWISRQSVPSPRWYDDYGDWPDCKNTTNWV